MTEHDVQHKFWPSPAIITTHDRPHKGYETLDEQITAESRLRNRREVLIWTPDAMARFWKETAKLRNRGTCGPLSISSSGPYPDPFRPVSSPWSVVSHRLAQLEPTSVSQPPVRMFAGDHLRIGCDLEHALIFRMWLGTRNFGFPSTTAQADQGKKARVMGENPFLRVKLCLVGPLGEVLAVI
jgi:hypothetical protein